MKNINKRTLNKIIYIILMMVFISSLSISIAGCQVVEQVRSRITDIKSTISGTPDYSDAMKTGNTEGFSDKQLEILEAVKSIINQNTSDSYTDYQNEVNIHDYLVKTVVYDEENLEKDTIPEDSFTAYGALINHVAVCGGYSEAFQILMDVLGIECKTIIGTGGENNISHAWNLVKLDDNWYHVDTTFDDPIPDTGDVLHTYLNVTDEVVAADHTWDKTAYPQAVSTTYDYIRRELTNIANENDMISYVIKQVSLRSANAQFLWLGNSAITNDQWQKCFGNNSVKNITFTSSGGTGRMVYNVTFNY